MKNIFIIFMALFVIKTSQAKTFYILFNGGAGSEINYYRFYNEIRRGYEVLKYLKLPVKIATADGTWDVTPHYNEELSKYSLTKSQNTQDDSYPPIDSAARSTEDLIKIIQSHKLNKGDNVVIFMNGHGKTSSPNMISEELLQPKLYRYSFWNNPQTWKSIANALKKIPSTINIKIATNTCYGGAIHHISRTLPNVCTTTSIPYMKESTSGIHEEGFFSKNFFGQILSSRGETSFAMASIFAMRYDIGNLHLGSLSSFDFVDYVLKNSPYNRRMGNFSNGWVRKDRLEYEEIRLPSNYVRSTPLFEGKIAIRHKLLKQIVSKFNPLMDKLKNYCPNSTQFEKSKRYLDKITKGANRKNEFSTVLHQAVNNMSRNCNQYLKLFKEYNSKYLLIKKMLKNAKKIKVSEIPQIYPILDPSYRGTKYEAVKRWNIFEREESKVRLLKRKLFDLKKLVRKSPLLEKLSLHLHMMDRLKYLGEFAKKSTNKQKNKFLSLLKCEWAKL